MSANESSPPPRLGSNIGTSDSRRGHRVHHGHRREALTSQAHSGQRPECRLKHPHRQSKRKDHRLEKPSDIDPQKRRIQEYAVKFGVGITAVFFFFWSLRTFVSSFWIPFAQIVVLSCYVLVFMMVRLAVLLQCPRSVNKSTCQAWGWYSFMVAPVVLTAMFLYDAFFVAVTAQSYNLWSVYETPNGTFANIVVDGCYGSSVTVWSQDWHLVDSNRISTFGWVPHNYYTFALASNLTLYWWSNIGCEIQCNAALQPNVICPNIQKPTSVTQAFGGLVVTADLSFYSSMLTIGLLVVLCVFGALCLAFKLFEHKLKENVVAEEISLSWLLNKWPEIKPEPPAPTPPPPSVEHAVPDSSTLPGQKLSGASQANPVAKPVSKPVVSTATAATSAAPAAAYVSDDEENEDNDDAKSDTDEVVEAAEAKSNEKPRQKGTASPVVPDVSTPTHPVSAMKVVAPFQTTTVKTTTTTIGVAPERPPRPDAATGAPAVARAAPAAAAGVHKHRRKTVPKKKLVVSNLSPSRVVQPKRLYVDDQKHRGHDDDDDSTNETGDTRSEDDEFNLSLDTTIDIGPPKFLPTPSKQ